MGLDNNKAKHEQGHGREVFFKRITNSKMSPLGGKHKKRHDDTWNKNELRIPNAHENEAGQ